MLYANLPAEERQAMFGKAAACLPAPRIAEPEHIAAAILFAVTNTFVTEATVTVGGGTIAA